MAAEAGGWRYGLILASALALGLAACGGGDDEGDSDTPPAEDAGNNDVNDLGSAISGAAGGLEEFEAWADPLRAAATITAEGDGELANVALGGPDGTGLVWRADSARIVDIDGNAIVLAPDGAQTLTFGEGGFALALDAARVRIVGGDAGLALTFTDATLGAGAWPVGDLGVTLQPADESGTVGEIDLEDLTLADGETHAFGPLVERLNLTVGPAPADDAGLAITSVVVKWGAIDLSGTGALTIGEDGAVSGELVAEVYDLLSALDTYHAFNRFDRDVYGEIFAAFLEDVNSENLVTVTIRIGNGTAMILGEDHGIADVELTGIVPTAAE